MKIISVVLMLSFALSGYTQTPSTANYTVIPSGIYSWKTPVEKKGSSISSRVLFEGAGRDMEYLRMSACVLHPSKRKTALQVPEDQEHLIMVKSGSLNIAFGDSSWSLAPGSIALLMPNQRFTLRSLQPCQFFLMAYRSQLPPDLSRGNTSGGSIVRDWNRLTFHKHDRGGVRRYFERPTAMCKRFEMHVTTLNAGLPSHDPHTHRAEEIILVLDDLHDASARTRMQIGDRYFDGKAGDIYYVGSNLLHGIRNEGSTACSYYAFQFE